MSLKAILDMLQDWCIEHNCVEEAEQFEKLCDDAMSVFQTYFTWDVDGDCFDIHRAFGTVMETIIDLQHEGRTIIDYEVGYLVDDKMILLIEYK